MSPEMTDFSHPPAAQLLIATGCAHCPVVLDGMTRLVKEGRLGRLEIINISTHPEAAQAAGTRSVPWFSIGPYRLTGLHSYQEIAEWAERAASGSGLSSYFSHLLETNRLEEVVSHIGQSPASISDLVLLLQDPDTPMAVRIGIGAAIEELAETPPMKEAVEPLGMLTRSEQTQVRADACHYLGLTGDPAAAPYLQSCLEDEDEGVREIAAESLALIHDGENDA